MDQTGSLRCSRPPEAHGADLSLAALHELPERGAGKARDRVGISWFGEADPDGEQGHPVRRIENGYWCSGEFLPMSVIIGIRLVVELHIHITHEIVSKREDT